jgi:hypothetical protein
MSAHAAEQRCSHALQQLREELKLGQQHDHSNGIRRPAPLHQIKEPQRNGRPDQKKTS